MLPPDAQVETESINTVSSAAANLLARTPALYLEPRAKAGPFIGGGGGDNTRGRRPPEKQGGRHESKSTNENGRPEESRAAVFYFSRRGECQGESLSSLLDDDGISVRALHYSNFRMGLGHNARGRGRFGGSFLFCVENGLALGHRAFKWKVA